MNKYILEFDIKSDWHIGNGHEGGAYAYALVVKNHLNLPYLPGKSIKGLLRQAFETAVDNQWFGDHALLNKLFGYENEGLFSQGIIKVSSAQLSDAETDFFLEKPSAMKYLYRVLQSTAINKQTGVAVEGSLRSLEVTVPMILQAEISLSEDQAEFQQHLIDAITLITELGAKRHRGLGQVTVTCKIKGES